MGQKFENVYLRSNLQCDGTIPERGSHAQSPDFFSNGITPLADFQKVLAASESYAAQPPDKSTVLRDNYCYLRCKNNSDHALSAKAQLFYTKASIVLWPDMWTPMTVDFKEDTLNDIPEMQPGEIGVVERPFIWNKPPTPATGDHYCMIGRLSTADTPNPIPPVYTPIDMAAIIQTNLMYAQRNLEIIDVDPGYNGYYHVALSTPPTLREASKYHLFLYPHELQGWDVEITCSMADSTGRQIGMRRTTVIDNDDIYCGQCMLEPGFTAIVSVYLYSNGNPVRAGASSRFILEYAVQDHEIPQARRLGLIDSARSDRLLRRAGVNDVHTAAVTSLGGYTAMLR